MAVDGRAQSPDFAAGEAEYLQKIKSMFHGLQAQYENEKISNQREFERDQQATEQGIRDLEDRCRDLERKMVEIKDAQRKAVQELELKKEENRRRKTAYEELETLRRRKYSAHLGGDLAATLGLMLGPRSALNEHIFSECETAQPPERDRGQPSCRSNQEADRNAMDSGQGSDVSFRGPDACVNDEAEHNSACIAPTAKNYKSYHMASIGSSYQSLKIDQRQQTNNATKARLGKRKRVPTAKAQALRGKPSSQLEELGGDQSKRNTVLPADGISSAGGSVDIYEFQITTPEASEQPNKRPRASRSNRARRGGQQNLCPALHEPDNLGHHPVSKNLIIPGVGSLFKKRWSLNSWHTLMVFPVGDLNGVGLSGHISDTVLFKQEGNPKCFTYSGKEVTGWAEGYEDGGPRVAQRVLPCLFFHDMFHVPSAETEYDVSDLPDQALLRWMKAEDLVPIDFKHKGKTFGLKPAQKFKASLGVINERRALASRQAEPSQDDSVDYEQDRQSQEQAQQLNQSDMGAAQPANHRGEQARTQPHEASFVHELSEEVPPTTISPNSPRETQATPTTSPTQENVQDSPTERVQITEVPTTEVPTTEVQTTSPMGRDGLEQDGTSSHQSQEKDGDQQQPITDTTGDTIVQQPHQGSTLEPMLPGPPQTNADDAESVNGRAAQGNGNESLDLDGMCWLDAAQRRQSQAISDEPGHHNYPHLLVDPVNAGNSGLIEVASKALEAQGPALVETFQNPESDARQMRIFQGDFMVANWVKGYEP
ncbi:hypothetical protein J7T55_006151 [Diaporthe amygdali]|uniref:uncharacterized protein n=1 Tax=Phomopsis amygdali TaxID=1214568 RepID=UPI0022FE70B8|nr:uncharacterized protein J7T55_006151 [Diaporthe amygdali]KAJ0124810.1 hypothetical protein J7T55_006151 [Diaporthe amygdali]